MGATQRVLSKTLEEEEQQLQRTLLPLESNSTASVSLFPDFNFLRIALKDSMLGIFRIREEHPCQSNHSSINTNKVSEFIRRVMGHTTRNKLEIPRQREENLCKCCTYLFGQ